MNILDRHYSEISFKTDAEDLLVIINFINEVGERTKVDHIDLKVKAAISLLKEIRDKLVMKEYQKRTTKKAFLLKFKPYHIAALLEIFYMNEAINESRPFEKSCIMQYRALFHQKLTGL